MSLTPDQVGLIKATVPILREHGLTITATFYKNMLAAHPELHSVFNTANQFNGHQPKALAGALFAYASHIDDLGALGPAVELICHKHASLYIQPEQYDIVGKYLLEAMGQVLGSALTPEILDAWATAYGQLAKIMIGREAELYRQSEGWTQFRDFRIAAKVPESAEITSFHLAPVDGQPLPKFQPGQYISVQLFVPDLKYPQARQYSLSDAPHADHYRISVRKHPGLDPSNPDARVNPGYVSNLLHDNVQEGDLIKVSHPYGDFFFREELAGKNPVVLLGAGVGLTPLMSILNTLAGHTAPDRPVTFIHGARTARARAFHGYVQGLKEKIPSLKTTFFNSEPAADEIAGVDYDKAGRISLPLLDRSADLHLDDPTTGYYVCGPESFMVDMRAWLREQGVSDDRLNLELFGTGGVPA
ncbi:globin-like protein [Aspergillus taichungensis]|uniref:nitric oxide dioxygenase n=1 Tax=Aspergillus taichungensis TaxID=482145 RepID=A0A2J5HQ79_9EURO|nr:globin-like protein [Aspergillus taichungensis]